MKPDVQKRIFVRGLSRSGGTLMVTVLDAHPQVAMSYELYEHLLAPSEAGEDTAQQLRRELVQATKKSFLPRRNPLKHFQNGQLRTFVARVQRSGIQADILLQLLEEHLGQGLNFDSFPVRMRFIELLARHKMNAAGKRHWGLKIDSAYEPQRELYPDAYFLFMRRDGRDMAASRKLVGNFNQTIEHIAETWQQQIARFRNFAVQPGVRARMVDYERLTAEPEAELREVIDFLGLEWDDRLLQFHDEDLTIYQNPMGHLSAQQVNQPINASSVGRWKRDLTPAEIESFESIAGPTLAAFGYEVSRPQMPVEVRP